MAGCPSTRLGGGRWLCRIAEPPAGGCMARPHQQSRRSDQQAWQQVDFAAGVPATSAGPSAPPQGPRSKASQLGVMGCGCAAASRGTKGPGNRGAHLCRRVSAARGPRSGASKLGWTRAKQASWTRAVRQRRSATPCSHRLRLTCSTAPALLPRASACGRRLARASLGRPVLNKPPQPQFLTLLGTLSRSRSMQLWEGLQLATSCSLVSTTWPRMVCRGQARRRFRRPQATCVD